MKIFLMLLFAVSAFAQTKAGDAGNGKTLFVKNGCYQCHGYAGQGGTAGGAGVWVCVLLAGARQPISNQTGKLGNLGMCRAAHWAIFHGCTARGTWKSV